MKSFRVVLSILVAAVFLGAAPVPVVVTRDEPVDILIDGQKMGSTQLKTGQTLDLVSKDGEFAVLSMGGTTTVKVPLAACRLPDEQPQKADKTVLAQAVPAPQPVTISAPPPSEAKSTQPVQGGSKKENQNLPSQFTLNRGSASDQANSTDTEKVNPNWKLVWSDEFEGDSVDPGKWEFEVNGDGGGNNELQYYTDRKKNAQVKDGKLIITAIKEDYTGPDGKKRSYTSARLKTKGKGDWKYGRMEARIKLVKGKGMWPAFWMMPTDAVYGGWARSGEIDIMELVGHEPNTVYGTLHYGDGWPRNVHTGDKTILKSGEYADDFHVFAVEWEEGVIRWYLDGVRYQTQTKWNTVNGTFPAPFDQKFFIILNLAVGGAWPGKPAETTRFPQSMEVDYVRVYQPQ